MPFFVSSDPLGSRDGLLEQYHCTDEQDAKNIAHKYALDRMLEGWEIKVLAIDKQENGVRFCRATYIMPSRQEIVNHFTVIQA